MRKHLKIWYRAYHDDYTVAHLGPLVQVKTIIKDGGAWVENAFILLHNINFIELTENEE